MFRQAKRNHAREEVATAPGPFSKLKKGIALREEIKVPPRDGTQGEREVIMSMGAIGSPQLLLLNGMGPRPYLSCREFPWRITFRTRGISSSSFVLLLPPSSLYLTVATLIAKISSPLSSGFLRLGSTDMRFNPVVQFNYFNNSMDVERCVNGSRKIGVVLKSKVPNDFRFRNWLEPKTSGL
ncbi:hypothetical protein HN51_043863 [Arachis hypogaea]